MIARNKLLSHAILILLLISATPLMLHTTSSNVSADSPEVWNQTSGNLASTDANWLDGTKPTTGDNIIFNTTSTASCTWDLADSFGSFLMDTGYSGTVSQTASFSVTSYSQVAGIFTGNTGCILTDSGTFTKTGGTITNNVLDLSLTGTGTTHSINANVIFYKLRVSGTSTITNNMWVICTTGVGALIVSGTLTNSAYSLNDYSSSNAQISGILAGAAVYQIDLSLNVNLPVYSGSINCPTKILIDSGVASRTATLSGNTVFGNTLLVQSADPSNTITLDANNYSLNATDITIGTRGIINGRASVITCSGNWDSSAGTFTQGTGQVVLSGTGKTVKTSSTTGPFYHLRISGNIAMTTCINITRNLLIDSGKILATGTNGIIDFNSSSGGTWSNLGSIIGSGQMRFSLGSTDMSITLGTISTAVRVRAVVTTDANRTLTLLSDQVFGSTLLVNSDHPTYWIFLDARQVYLRAVGAITEGTRGDILYSTFSIVSSPGYGGGVQTGHSYAYQVNLSTTASPGEIYTFTSNATWLHWDSSELAVYGTPDSIYGGHWYWVNVSLADGMLTDYQNYTVLVVGVETLQEYIPLLLSLMFGLGLLVVGLRFRELWILAGPVWIICGMTIFITYGMVFLLVSVGLGIVLMFKGVSPYL